VSALVFGFRSEVGFALSALVFGFRSLQGAKDMHKSEGAKDMHNSVIIRIGAGGFRESQTT
jgi:hypothetical protein